MEKEIWKDVIGYEGLYQISNLGRVKSLPRKIRYLQSNTGVEHFRLTKEKILSYGNCKGYNSISLSKENTTITYRVCRLVAINFIDNEENKPQVNHIDGNKKNDCVSNLEWVTASENMKHAYDNKLTNNCFVNKDVRICKKVICTKTNKIFNSINEAAEYFNLSPSFLSRSLRNIYVNNTTLILLNAKV